MPLNETLQQDLSKDLLVESHEGLDLFDRELLALALGQGDRETLNHIVRVIPTIKDTAGCLGLGKIEKTAHSGENPASLLRDGKLTTTPEMITTVLAIIPALIGTSGGDRCAIPQVSLVEFVRLGSAQVRQGIERLCGAPVFL